MLNNMKKKSINFLTQKRKPQELIEFKIKNSKEGLGYEQEEEKKIKNGKIETFSFYGKSIIINKGEFKGQKGKILLTNKYESFQKLFEENDYILIELDINGQKHEIKNNYISLVDNEKESEIKIEEEKKEIKREKITWIKPNIIVRIIDEKSKYYNTKAKVEDIISDDTFSLLMNDNTLNNEFTEDDCETYIPKLNENVLIIIRKYKNKKGKLI